MNYPWKTIVFPDFINIKVITLTRPWAEFVAWNWKTIETRTTKKFESLVDEVIGIHAGKKWDKNWLALAGKYLSDEQIESVNEKDLAEDSGNIIAVGFCVGFRKLLPKDSKDALIFCGVDPLRYGNIIENIRILPHKVPFTGTLGSPDYHLPPTNNPYLAKEKTQQMVLDFLSEGGEL